MTVDSDLLVRELSISAGRSPRGGSPPYSVIRAASRSARRAYNGRDWYGFWGYPEIGWELLGGTYNGNNISSIVSCCRCDSGYNGLSGNRYAWRSYSYRFLVFSRIGMAIGPTIGNVGIAACLAGVLPYTIGPPLT